MKRYTRSVRFLAALLLAASSATVEGQERLEPEPPESLPRHLRDRGTGVATSMFGTYVRRGELIVYPFFEYYRDADFEYAPAELGFGLEEDFRGRYRAKEGLLLLAYGAGEDLALELEAAVIDAALDKAPDDPSGMPSRIEEKGLGDVEGQVRWRFRRETEDRPELFAYGEIVFPHAADKPLTGTPGWELKAGVGAVRGFGFGTMTVRAAIEYSEASTSHFDVGEYAIECLRRVSPRLRVHAGLEGTQDELSLITEAQVRLSRHAVLKLNNGFGLTSKATDWAPEVGILFTIPTRSPAAVR